MAWITFNFRFFFKFEVIFETFKYLRIFLTQNVKFMGILYNLVFFFFNSRLAVFFSFFPGFMLLFLSSSKTLFNSTNSLD